MSHVLIIIASVRPKRVGDQIAGWIMGLASRIDGFTFEPLDLKHWHLPLDDEPDQPKRAGPGGYTHQHTLAWSDKVGAASGFVFLTPQYNWGYPASLKNALDHLYHEWVGKPAVIISYGHRGGTKAAAQLREVLLALHMVPTATMPALFLKDETLDAERRLADPARAFASRESEILRAIGELGLGSSRGSFVVP